MSINLDPAHAEDVFDRSIGRMIKLAYLAPDERPKADTPKVRYGWGSDIARVPDRADGKPPPQPEHLPRPEVRQCDRVARRHGLEAG